MLPKGIRWRLIWEYIVSNYVTCPWNMTLPHLTYVAKKVFVDTCFKIVCWRNMPVKYGGLIKPLSGFGDEWVTVSHIDNASTYLSMPGF